MTKSKYQNKSQFQNPKLNFGFGILDLFGSIWILGFILFFALNFNISHLYAQDKDKLVALSKQVIEAKTNEEAAVALEALADLYLKEHKYNDFEDCLDSLLKQKKTIEPLIYYYMASSRYQQLKYLEETQGWDEYFSKGNSYRDQIVSAAQKSIAGSSAKEAYFLYTRLTLWKFHRDQDDELSSQALSDLMSSVLEYAKDAKDIQPVKKIADQLSAYGEKAQAKELYRTYVDRIAVSNLKDEELNSIATSFYKEGNLDLAQAVYDVYVERIQKAYAKEKLLPVLVGIAKMFSSQNEGLSDAFYAEKILKKIEDIGGKEFFDQNLIYMRAFNLEKEKEYAKAKDYYLDLLQRYPNDAHKDEADFKAGMISAYVLRDIKVAKAYFEKLAGLALQNPVPEGAKEEAKQEISSPYVISSLYQLGLLSQWAQDFPKAQEYYNKLLEKARSGFSDTVELAKERLKEIQDAKPIEYNLKTFLDVSLQDEYAMFDMTKLDLRSRPYSAKKEQKVGVSSSAYTAASGCMQVELQYLWSGHLGKTKPALTDSSFEALYDNTGTKEINLVVVSPTGIIDRSIELVDIY